MKTKYHFPLKRIISKVYLNISRLAPIHQLSKRKQKFFINRLKPGVNFHLISRVIDSKWDHIGYAQKDIIWNINFKKKKNLISFNVRRCAEPFHRGSEWQNTLWNTNLVPCADLVFSINFYNTRKFHKTPEKQSIYWVLGVVDFNHELPNVINDD